MDDVKDKMKGFMKKFNTSSSSSKFKGQGRVLGSSSSSMPSNQVNSNPNRPSTRIPDPKPAPSPSPRSDSSVLPQKPKIYEQAGKSTNGFDPFDALITTGKRNKNGYDLKVFECLVCSRVFRSEQEESDHVESCLSDNELQTQSRNDENDVKVEVTSELDTCVGTYVSWKPSDGSVEVVLKLLRNIVKEPKNVKFRKIRLGNPKIKEAIADVAGGLDLLECVGFELREENGEMWAVWRMRVVRRLS